MLFLPVFLVSLGQSRAFTRPSPFDRPFSVYVFHCVSPSLTMIQDQKGDRQAAIKIVSSCVLRRAYCACSAVQCIRTTPAQGSHLSVARAQQRLSCATYSIYGVRSRYTQTNTVSYILYDRQCRRLQGRALPRISQWQCSRAQPLRPSINETKSCAFGIQTLPLSWCLRWPGSCVQAHINMHAADKSCPTVQYVQLGRHGASDETANQ